MSKSLDEALDYCREAAREGQSFDDIKAEVVRWNLDREQQKRVLLKADDYVYQVLIGKQEREKALNRMLVGGVLLAAGLAILYVSDVSSKIEYIIPFVAIFIGGWQLKEGYKVYRQPIEITEESNFPQGRNKFDRF